MNGRMLYQPYDAHTVINKFIEYVKNYGEDFSQWFIGISHFAETKEGIKHCYELNHSTIINFMMDDSDIEKVFDYFIQKGMKSNQRFKYKTDDSKITNSTIFIYKLL